MNLGELGKMGALGGSGAGAATAPNPVNAGGGMAGLSMPASGGAGSAIGAGIGTMIAPGPGTIIGAGVGSLLDLGLSLWGSSKQSRKEEEDRQAAREWAEIQNELAKRERSRHWKWVEEERDYSYAQDFQKNLWNFLNADEQLKSNLRNVWRK